MSVITKSTVASQLVANASTMGNAAISGSIAGGGILWWFGQNATAVGAMCVVIGLIAGIIFKTIGYIELKRHHKEMEDD